MNVTQWYLKVKKYYKEYNDYDLMLYSKEKAISKCQGTLSFA